MLQVSGSPAFGLGPTSHPDGIITGLPASFPNLAGATSPFPNPSITSYAATTPKVIPPPTVPGVISPPHAATIPGAGVFSPAATMSGSVAPPIVPMIPGVMPHPAQVGGSTTVGGTGHLFPLPPRSGIETAATASGVMPSVVKTANTLASSFSQPPAPNIPGMPVTTPISLPGMPPITVSATLPYNTLEGLQVTEHQPVTVPIPASQ
ncbi:hypothetical protein L9F63_026351 [Diploptera punctata]|uniref:Uncharacterized protein n=1 Tax=Diploptera punctata TaxID=6984 RepID=A0AAD8ES67_DIPPU|nr:hypothetical protein L9F63_026351 [Diploptera punctata]